MAQFTSSSHITTMEEVKSFFRHIVYDLNINFHPDDDFMDYVNYGTDERVLDDEQAALYNRLTDEAFDVCGDKVYEIASQLMRERIETE